MGLLRRTDRVAPSFHPDLDRYLGDRALRAAILQPHRIQAVDDPRGSKLTGMPYLPAGEGWPGCEQCGRPLHHLFQINFNEIGFPALEGIALLSLFYCIGCSPEDSSMPGYRVLLRSDLTADPQSCPLPAIPPQAEQPLPVILLDNRAKPLTARFGPDLPSPFDEGLRGVLDSLEVLPGTPLPPPGGPERFLRLRIRKDGEEHELNLQMAPGSEFDLEAWSQHVEVLAWEITAITPRPDYPGLYQQYLQRLYQAGELARSKIGGWVHGAQEPRFTHCSCGEPLVHLVTIMTGGEISFVVGDVGGLYLAACPRCSDGQLYWWTDYY